MASSSSSSTSHRLMPQAQPSGPPPLPQSVPPCLPHRLHPVYNSYHFPQCSGTLPLLSSGLGGMAGASGTAGSTDSSKPESRLEHEFVRAVTANDVERVQELLDSDPQFAANINVLSPTAGLAPIHYAAARGFLPVVQLLLAQSADVDLVDKEGETPLLKAAYGGHVDVLRHLLTKNPNVEHQDRDGWSALHNCCSGGHLFGAKYLIEAGCNVSIQSNNGHTPLMIASGKGFVDLVELLLNNRADPTTVNKFGDTAYDLAAQAEEPYICEILQNSEQDVIERRNRASGNSQTRGPLMVQHNTVIELIHENQRCGFLSRQFSDTNLNKSDLRGPWSTALGRPCSLDDVQLPLVRDAQTGQLVRGWFWLSDWRVDTKHPRVDAVDGWQYAKTFDDPDMQWLAAPIGSVLNTWVRRRRWIRVRKRRADVRSEEQAKEEESSEAEANQDYLTVARNRIERMSAGEDNQNLNSVKAELDEYENSIKELLAGIKDDTDLIRKRAASALVSAYLEQAEERNALIDALEESDDAEEGEDKDQSQSQAHSKGKGPATIGRGQASTDSNIVTESPQDSPSNDQIGNSNTNSDNGDSINFGRSQSMPINPLAGTDLTPLSMSPPSSWQRDEEAPQCESCDRRFTLWLRRHHCRWCGRVFCASCTSLRLPLVPNTPPNRVCRTCYTYLSSRNEIPTAPSSLTSDASEPPPSPSRSTASRPESAMNECPVCQKFLNPQIMMEDEIEEHIATCLDGVATSRGQGQMISGNRYIVQVLKEDLPAKECAICFEEFLQGHRIARLNCLCLYHEHCIEAWFTNPKFGKRTCPIHFR